MILGGSFLGSAFLTNGVVIFNENSYDKITLFGEGKFDKVWIRNVEDSAYYNTITNIEDYVPVFDTDTSFLAEFNGNLSAGSLSTGGDPILSWIVSKRSSNGNINRLVGEFAPNISSAYDYRAKRGENYIYQITPKTETQLGQSLLSTQIESEYYGIFLIDEDSGLILNFNLNGNIGNMSANDDMTIYETFNKYGTISKGKRNYLSGTIQGVVPETLDYCTNGVIQGTDFIDLVQDYVASDSSKLLKTRKGDIFKIETSNFSRSQFVNESRQQVDMVSFDWVEIEDVIEYK